MYGLNDLWIVCLQLIDVSQCSLSVFLNFFQYHFQVFSVEREGGVEGMFCFFSSLDENRCNLIYKVDFGNKHSGDIWTNKRYIFKVHVELNGLHSEVAA